MTEFQLTDESSIFCKMKTWTLEECARIVCGVPINKKFDRSNPADVRALYVQVLLERMHDDDITEFRPLRLLAKLKELEIDVPEILFSECTKNDSKYYKSDILQDSKRLRSKIKKLQRDIEDLTELTREFSPKRAGTLYRMLHAAIRMKYKAPSAQDPHLCNELFKLVEEYEGAPQGRTLNLVLDETLSYVSNLTKVQKTPT